MRRSIHLPGNAATADTIINFWIKVTITHNREFCLKRDAAADSRSCQIVAAKVIISFPCCTYGPKTPIGAKSLIDL